MKTKRNTNQRNEMKTKKTTKVHGFKTGKCYLIRTVTNYWTGRLIRIGPQELTLEDASWIADTGRFSQALNGPDNLNEVEPVVPNVIVGRGSVVDAIEWLHPLPRVLK